MALWKTSSPCPTDGLKTEPLEMTRTHAFAAELIKDCRVKDVRSNWINRQANPHTHHRITSVATSTHWTA